VTADNNDSTAAEDNHCERLHSRLVYDPTGGYVTPYDINGMSRAFDSVSEALDRHAFEDEVGVRSSPSFFSCKLIRGFQFEHHNIRNAFQTLSPTESSPSPSLSSPSASTLPAEHSNSCLPLSVISGYRASSPELYNEVPESLTLTAITHTSSPSTDIISSMPVSHEESNLPDIYTACDAADDDYEVADASVYSPSRSASPILMYPDSTSPIDPTARFADNEAWCSAARSPSPLSVASPSARASSVASNPPPRSPSPPVSYYRRSMRISSLPKRSLAEMDDDGLEQEFEAAAEAGPSNAPHSYKRRKTDRVDSEEDNYTDSEDEQSICIDTKDRQTQKRTGKGKTGTSKGSKRNFKSSTKGRNKPPKGKKNSFDRTCTKYPDCGCAKCYDCKLCFTRKADMTRHKNYSPAHQPTDVDADRASLRCRICHQKLQRADARIRHEKRGSCGKARWTMDSRRRNPRGGGRGDRNADPGAAV
jgi:hypothetical protein